MFYFTSSLFLTIVCRLGLWWWVKIIFFSCLFLLLSLFLLTVPLSLCTQISCSINKLALFVVLLLFCVVGSFVAIYWFFLVSVISSHVRLHFTLTSISTLQHVIIEFNNLLCLISLYVASDCNVFFSLSKFTIFVYQVCAYMCVYIDNISQAPRDWRSVSQHRLTSNTYISHQLRLLSLFFGFKCFCTHQFATTNFLLKKSSADLLPSGGVNYGLSCRWAANKQKIEIEISKNWMQFKTFR